VKLQPSVGLTSSFHSAFRGRVHAGCGSTNGGFATGLLAALDGLFARRGHAFWLVDLGSPAPGT
jgi:hypothetical protein